LATNAAPLDVPQTITIPPAPVNLNVGIAEQTPIEAENEANLIASRSPAPQTQPGTGFGDDDPSVFPTTSPAPVEVAGDRTADGQSQFLDPEQRGANQEAAAKAKVEAEAKAKAETIEKARQEAIEKAAADKARQEIESKAKTEAAEKARQEAIAKAEADRLAKESVEKTKREAEEKARQEAIAAANEAKAKVEAEAKAKAEATEKARQEAKSGATRAKDRLAEFDKAGGKDADVVLREAAADIRSEKAWGTINFGDGKGAVSISKEEYLEYAKRFKAK
jgi:hypothetical protein